MASDSKIIQQDALVKAGVHFRIARTLPTKFEEEKGLVRYQPVLKVLDGIKEAEVTPDNVERVVRDAQQEISSQYGERKVLSLTTKFLWLKIKSPIRIYDRQARIALGTREGDFSAFNAEFSIRFAEFASEIDEACTRLKSVVSYSVHPKMRPSGVETLTSKQWFKERVFDIYLWNKGSV